MVKFRCKGITSCGKRCKLKKKGAEWCQIHKHQNKNEFCAICFENIKTRTELECEHSFCNTCILRWMCKSYTCPNCRQEITDSRLKWRSIHYGVRCKLLLIIQVSHIHISVLSESEQDFLELLGITPFMFMGEEEWDSMKTYIEPEILEKIQITKKESVMKVNSSEDWEFYRQFDKIYLFD